MAGYTPMMQQYFEIKKEYGDCILFYRLGDFYEMFFDDALTASRELDITLTGRDCGQEERAPMCGVPYHSADGYIAKLIEKGYKVAICEQVEDPKATKTIVKREVIRVITPGTIIDNKMLEEGKNNYIMCIYEGKGGFGIAVADVSTGDFLTTSFSTEDGKRVTDEIAKYAPAEIIANEGFGNKALVEGVFNLRCSTQPPWAFEYVNACKCLCDHFGVLNLKGFGISEDELAIGASGGLMDYLYKTQMNALAHITALRNYSLNEYMGLDISSRKNLELCETLRDKQKKGSLLWVLDKTMTAMGGRVLRQWIEQPLLNVEEIQKRLDAVEEFLKDPLYREEMKEILNTVYDIERILSRITYKTANARDLIALKKSIEHFPSIKMLLMQLKTPLSVELYEGFDCLEDLYRLILQAIVEEPPITVREGGMIKPGYNEELDRYIEAKNKGSQWLLDFEQREREETGIKNLRIKYNKVFGYFIEITNSYKHLAPDSYIRRQTLSNAERYTTLALKEIEDEILGADEKLTELEYTLFCQIRDKIAAETLRIRTAANIVAVTDILQSLADVADKNQYVKPVVNNGGVIDIREGRHPVVEKVTDGFITNDTFLDKDQNRVAVITGPNMAGKSTYMRQSALIVLMAQIGCFVPATSAEIGVVDKIFTRVGASDDLATGQSTFMVEMSEVANILNNATNNSLLILDEIGRGTSTHDGLSIAWAVLEYIADKNRIGAKTLCATHYHELTELEGIVDGVVNYRITVQETGNEVIFLRKIARGGADRSYGVHVAKMAGVPGDVISRAYDLMAGLTHNENLRKERLGKKDDVDVVYYGTKKNPSSSYRKNQLIEEILQVQEEVLSDKEAFMRRVEEIYTRSTDEVLQ